MNEKVNASQYSVTFTDEYWEKRNNKERWLEKDSVTSTICDKFLTQLFSNKKKEMRHIRSMSLSLIVLISNSIAFLMKND